MKIAARLLLTTLFALAGWLSPSLRAADAPPALTLTRDGHWLVIRSPHIPAGEIRINYLEAYCRAGSTDADWVKHTIIKHTSEFVSLSDDAKNTQAPRHPRRWRDRRAHHHRERR